MGSIDGKNFERPKSLKTQDRSKLLLLEEFINYENLEWRCLKVVCSSSVIIFEEPKPQSKPLPIAK